MDAPEVLLVSQAQEGDADAFEKLFEAYHQRIYNYVGRMLQDPVESEDVAQETFVRAFQALDDFQQAASFRTWLYRIAANLAVDATRRRQRQWQLAANDHGEGQTEEEVADPAGRTPDDLLERANLRSLVWRAVGELSDKLRPVLVMYDMQGLSYDEIAAKLGCPLGTVKSRLFNARLQLRRRLAELLPEEVVRELKSEGTSN
jgi:RNA polymerase sigma-70 factor (ECF subfamily)